MDSLKKLIDPEGNEVVTHSNGVDALLAKGYTLPEEAPAEKSIDDMSGKELDSFAANLGIADWNAKATVAKKRDAIKAHQAASAAGTDDGLDELSDDDLKAKAEEAGVSVEENADRDAIIAAIRDAAPAE